MVFLHIFIHSYSQKRFVGFIFLKTGIEVKLIRTTMY